MSKNVVTTSFFLILVLTLLLALSLPALADKPSSAGNKGKSSKSHKKEKNNNSSQAKNEDAINLNVYFNTDQRKIIRNYYTEEFHRGHCPPGLAKKNNGCMPPGQAKKWKKGYPLPQDVVYYDLPASVVVQLGGPPQGHRYIRVATDILLMAIGTGMIVDAIQDVNSM